MLDHAAGLHASGLAQLVHLDAHRDRLVAVDGQEVDVDEPAVDVVALDLAGDGHVSRAVDQQVDEEVRARVRVQQVQQLSRVHGEGHRLGPVSVEDRGDSAGRAKLARHALAGAVAPFRRELRLHGRVLRGRVRKRIVPRGRARRPVALAARYSWLWPPKISLTLESSKTARSALAISGAIDSTLRLSKLRSSGIGTVFVTTTCSI